MELNYLTDHLFDLLNESDILDITEIEPTEQKDGFRIKVFDGTVFHIYCRQETGYCCIIK